MEKITTNLWFDTEAEEAVTFYTSVFKNSRIGRISRYGKEGFEFHKQTEGTAMIVEFELEGRSFTALNAGPNFKFNEAISFIIHCETQAELDYYWDKLSEGGDLNAQQCGWLKDKYGLSWQVIPQVLATLMSSSDREKSQKVMNALLAMKKIIIQDLENAFNS